VSCSRTHRLGLAQRGSNHQYSDWKTDLPTTAHHSWRGPWIRHWKLFGKGRVIGRTVSQSTIAKAGREKSERLQCFFTSTLSSFRAANFMLTNGQLSRSRRTPTLYARHRSPIAPHTTHDLNLNLTDLRVVLQLLCVLAQRHLPCRGKKGNMSLWGFIDWRGSVERPLFSYNETSGLFIAEFNRKVW